MRHRVRHLTPLACWGLQGRQDWEFDRAKSPGIELQFKQADNSLFPQIIQAIASGH